MDYKGDVLRLLGRRIAELRQERQMTIDTLGGKIKLTAKPETQNGAKIRLKGKGFPVYKQEGHFGDLYITYNIKIPVNLSEKEKQLFKELSQLRP